MAGELRYLFKLTGSMIGSTLSGLFGNSTPTPPPGGSPPPPGPGDIEAPFVPEASPDLWADFMDAIGGEAATKKQVTAKREVIGVKSARLIKQPDTLTTTTFDTTSRPGFVEVLLTNSTGSSLTMNGIAIVGLPVVKVGGEDGYIHDDFVDYESIAADGERAFELGNDFICTKQQIEALADYWWKYHDPKSRKHMYVGFVYGTRYDLAPGQRYTLQIVVDNKGIYEDIDSTVELYSVDIERQPGQPGRTSFMFREVEESWEKTTFYRAKFSVGGNAQRKISRSSTIFVGASTYTEESNYVCDGTADDVQIQAAIDVLANTGGGSVVLSPGTFYTTSTINIKSGVTIIGSGPSTIIEKNANGEGLKALGSSGSELSNIGLFDFTVTRNASDTNAEELLRMDYTDNVIVRGVRLEDSDTIAVVMANCDGVSFTAVDVTSSASLGIVYDHVTRGVISECSVIGASGTGILISSISGQSSEISISDCTVSGQTVSGAFAYSGILAEAANSSITNCRVVDAVASGSATIYSGIRAQGASNVITSCIVENCTSVAQFYGIYNQGANASTNGSTVLSCGGGSAVYGVAGGATGTSVSGCTIKTLSNSGTSVTIGVNVTVNGTCSSCLVDGVTNTTASSTQQVRGFGISQNANVSGCRALNITTSSTTQDADGFVVSSSGASVTGCTATACDDDGFNVQGDNNVISACFASGNDYGILTESTADKTVITGNRLTGNTTANLQDNGTNTTTTGNNIT